MEKIIEKSHGRLSLVDTTFVRSLADRIDWSSRLIGIRGARGVGKTTLLLQYMKQKHGFANNALYCSLDDIWFAEHRLSDLVDIFVKRGGRYLFLDEVHTYPPWLREIKNFYDNYPNLHIVFTGSSLLNILNARSDLSRRADMYMMQGLSFREYLAMFHNIVMPAYSLSDILSNHIDISLSTLEICKPLQFFSDYLKYGYYPFSLDNLSRYYFRLEEVVNMILEIELPLLRGVDRAYVHKLKQLLQIVSRSAPFVPNISKLAERIGVARATLITYLNYLEEVRLLNLIYKDAGGVAKLQKPDKLFLENSNLAYMLGAEQIDKGGVRETFFINQLSYLHSVNYSAVADFFVDGKFTFEVEGRKKTKRQIGGVENSYIVSDDIEFGTENRIPLWIFGLMY